MLKENSKEKRIFVIQKHYATHLHYDFRLEVNGVLASWAVPRGIPDKDEKRLAVQVEDHDLKYANFEGEIEEGYGKGSVEIWDKGFYENLKAESMAECLKKGKIEINLKGKKAKGNFALIRTNLGGKKNNWLIFRMNK